MAQSSYQKRIEKYLREHPGATKSEARGHGKTPEHPHEAGRNPEKYKDYINRTNALKRQVRELKSRLFSVSDKWRADRSARYVATNPVTEKPPRMDYMQRFVDEGESLFGSADFSWSDEEWGFLWYH